MATASDKTGSDPAERPAVPPMEAVLEEVEKLLRAALQKDRPQSQAEREALDLYRANQDSRGKTVAVLAACLSDWQAFARHLDVLLAEGPLGMDVIAAHCIHRAALRKRTVEYRAEQMGEQIRQANVRDRNGDWWPFDPRDPRAAPGAVKELQEEIAYLLEKRPVKDRLVLEMSIDGYIGKEIVAKVRETLPEERISEATVSRLWKKFKRDLRQRLAGA